MRVLLDECLPRALSDSLTGHQVVTVPQQGWAGKLNGELLDLASQQFDIFLTIDQNLPAQQRVDKGSLAVVVVRALSNDITVLRPLVPDLLRAIATIQPGTVTYVGPR